MFYDRFDGIIYEFLWALLSCFTLFYNCNCVIMHLFYFMLICLHVCMKLRCLNIALQMSFKMKSIRINRIISLMSNLNTIYNEIHQFNNEFWGSILLICLTDHVIFICTLFYDLIYGELTSDYIL